jgi:hypothetical protein
VRGQLHASHFTPIERGSGIHWIGGWEDCRATLDMPLLRLKSCSVIMILHLPWLHGMLMWHIHNTAVHFSPPRTISAFFLQCIHQLDERKITSYTDFVLLISKDRVHHILSGNVILFFFLSSIRPCSLLHSLVFLPSFHWISNSSLSFWLII